MIVLLGHPDYYPRFGVRAGVVRSAWRHLGDMSDRAWMARRLPAWTPDVRGRVRYPADFEID